MGKKRPPKPSDRQSVPRFKKANPSSAKSATLDALGKITNAEIMPEHFETYAREVSAIGNDRGAAILLAVQLEDVLGYALTLRLKIPNDRVDEVFGHNAAMGTFDNKIRTAYAIGIITPKTRFVFDVVRRIRNAFAHARVPVSFTTPEIAAACRVFDLPNPLPPIAVPADGSVPVFTEPRQRFMRTCEVLTHNLFVVCGSYAHGGSSFPLSF
jgi:hypothetical protein